MEDVRATEPASGDLSPNAERRLAMLENAPEFEPARVARAVEALTGVHIHGAPVFVPRGLGNQNWLVNTNQGRLLVKIGARDAPVAKWRAASIALGLAMRAGVPAPRLVAWHQELSTLDGRVVRIFQAVDGYTLDDPEGPGEAPDQVWTELGAAVRCLHGIHLDAFSSRLDGSAPSFATWDAYLAYRIAQIQARAAASHWLDGVDLSPFWSAVQAAARRAAPVVHPTLTHRDLHVDNVLISPFGSLAAILDWDQAEAWDPVADFFKLRWLLFEEVPAAGPAFVAGYGTPAAVHPEFERRLQIASAIELVSTIAGAGPDEALAVRRLHERLRALAAATSWPYSAANDRTGR